MEAAIWQQLENHFYRSATFLAERLVAMDTSNENSKFVLATCYYRSGQIKSAYHILKKTESLKCVFLFARCCLDLKQYVEGKTRLLNVWPRPEVTDIILGVSSSSNKDVPDRAAVLCLLGHLCRGARNEADARKYYQECLKLSPFMWEAFEAFCQMGLIKADRERNPEEDDVDPDLIFRTNKEHMLRAPCTDIQNSRKVTSTSTPMFTRGEKGYHITRRAKNLGLKQSPISSSTQQIDHREKKRRISTEDSSAISTLDDDHCRARSPRDTRLSSHMDIDEEFAQEQQQSENDFDFETKEEKEIKNMEVHTEIMTLLKKVAKGCAHMSYYECRSALDVFKTLPKEQLESPFILCQLAKAHFELAEYDTACGYFDQAHRAAPYRHEDMEIYSTVLWHLRKDNIQSALANELLEFDRRSPQAWITAGNCFSRRHEHQNALKCFRRAIQLDPSFTYAHTLSGHENMANRNYDQAMTHFRKALTTNPRHYNALYGLANYFLTCGKRDEAEQHYRKALNINPNSAVLLCCYGKILEKLGRSEEAHSMYEKACQRSPRAPLALFKRAKALFKQEDFGRALQEAQDLLHLAPQEPKIHVLIGTIFKARGDRLNANKHFTRALDIDNQYSLRIREAIERPSFGINRQ